MRRARHERDLAARNEGLMPNMFRLLDYMCQSALIEVQHVLVIIKHVFEPSVFMDPKNMFRLKYKSDETIDVF